MAKVAGVRLISRLTSDAEEAQAIAYGAPNVDVYSSSWGPQDDARRLDGAGHLSAEVLEAVVNGNAAHPQLHGRGGLGSIYIWAAGNGAAVGDNCNYDSWANSRYTITVAAITDLGTVAKYSEPCSAILVAAPSSGGNRSITTTAVSLAGDGKLCTSKFGGTSAATPSIAGIVALMLESNPRLTWRDVQHILVHSASLGGLQPDTQINAGAHIYSHSLGFGVPSAWKAVMLADSWTNVGPARVADYYLPIDEEIRGPVAGLRRCVSVQEQFLLEHVEVILNAKHPRRGDLEVYLVGTMDVQSRLAEMHGDSNPDYRDWRFMSVAYWDSGSQGLWCLTLRDRRWDQRGIWKSWQLRLWGR